jgi:DinB superfamily
METTKLFDEIDTVVFELIASLSVFTEQQINQVPFEGSWTPGQVVQHISMSVDGFSKLITGTVVETQRNPDEHVGNLKAAFLNYDIKMKTPDFIIPLDKHYEKEELSEKLKSIKKKLSEFDVHEDMTKTCVDFKLPALGFLTRTEICHFIVYHSRRHMHQLKNIYNAIND